MSKKTTAAPDPGTANGGNAGGINMSQIATEIGEMGDDEALTLLAKGIHDAVGTMGRLANRVLDLTKGKNGDDDEGSDDDEGGEGGDDDAPGYQDMQMGSTAGAGSVAASIPAAANPAAGGDGGMVDVTDMVFAIRDNVSNLTKAVSDQSRLLGQLVRENAALRAQNVELMKAVADGAVATGEILAPLAKAVAETRTGLLNTPAPGITPPTAALRPKAKPVDAALIGGDANIEKRALLKAMNAGVIDRAALQSFQSSRRFAPDDDRNTAIRRQVEALATPGAAATA